MPVDIDAQPGRLLVRATGRVTVDEVIEAFAALARDDRLPAAADRLVLVDAEARLDGMTVDALRRMREAVAGIEAAMGAHPTWRIAFVVPEPVHRGLAALYAALWDAEPDAGVRVLVTEDRATAEAWLARPRPDRAP